MSLRKTNLVSGEIYHIYNRGVDKRNIVLDDKDRIRFIHDLFEFNNTEASLKLNYFCKNISEVGLPNLARKQRNILVEILSFCLMDNHFHLLIRQKADKGITEFMRKLGTGYTNYFNHKYERIGALFQGKFKSVHVNMDAHFLYLPIYIHLNPLDFEFEEWREGKVHNYKEALDFLDSYRWSSYMDYTGHKNFPSIIQKDFLLDRLGSEEKQKKEIIDWLKSFNFNLIREIILE